MKIFLSVNTPIRSGLSWERRWKGHDDGLISCWERGREIAAEDRRRVKDEGDPLTRTERSLSGELPVLPWKGGVEEKIKSRKYGSLKYLATLQGILGQPLNIDTDAEVMLTCGRTGMQVTYTGDRSKYVTE